MREIDYNADSVMESRFPEIKKLGAVSPNGESSPFVWNGRLMRLELCDNSHGNDFGTTAYALIRDCYTGEVLSCFGEGCYYYSFYSENDTAYVIGTISEKGMLAGDGFMIFESRDLISWTSRPLLRNPGWRYYNSSLTKGPDGYVLLMEASHPEEYVGKPFTLFFATSPDLVHWTFMDYDKCFSTQRYNGGPYMRYSRGWYYVISVTELPCRRYTNYIFRTQDFENWYVGLYNPILMPDNLDKKISERAFGFSPEALEKIKTGFNSNNSDIDMCEWEGKTLLTYNVGNQLGFYYIAEAVCDMPIDDFLEAYFI